MNEDIEKKWEENNENQDELEFLEPQEFEDFEEDYDSDSLLTDVKYDKPTDTNAYIDTTEGRIIKREDMTLWEIIKEIAKENETDIKDPKENCKHCLGRGYDGVDSETKMPVPCRCLFRGKTKKEIETENAYDGGKLNRKVTREQRRRMTRFLKKTFDKQRKMGIIPGQENEEVEEQEEKVDNRKVNKVLREYIKLNSFKKTATSLDMTLTETKKIIKGNKKKLEKMINKENK